MADKVNTTELTKRAMLGLTAFVATAAASGVAVADVASREASSWFIVKARYKTVKAERDKCYAIYSDIQDQMEAVTPRWRDHGEALCRYGVNLPYKNAVDKAAFEYNQKLAKDFFAEIDRKNEEKLGLTVAFGELCKVTDKWADVFDDLQGVTPPNLTELIEKMELTEIYFGEFCIESELHWLLRDLKAMGVR